MDLDQYQIFHLFDVAKRNGTQDAALDVAKQWMEKAGDHIAELEAEVNRLTKGCYVAVAREEKLRELIEYLLATWKGSITATADELGDWIRRARESLEIDDGRENG